jgi:predicted aldo/keto reductase-like oxidoreductase
MMRDSEMTRRDFLRDGAAAAGVAAAMAAAGPDRAEAAKATGGREDRKKTRSYNPNMEYRRLGRTGIWVSAVSLGGHWKRIDKVLGGAPARRGGAAFDKNRRDVVSRCLEVGINYIDACCGQEILAYAEALRGRREKMYFGYSWHLKESRFPEWRSARKLLQGLDEGLRDAKLEYVDLWRISMLLQGSRHTDGEADEMAAALEKAKKQGKTRFGGLSSHDRPWIKKVIEKYPDQVEVILTPYTATSKELPKESLFDAVRKHDVGVLGIKPFASNSLFKGDGSPGSPHAAEDDRRARLAIRYILTNPAITAPIPGLISIHQVDNMVRALKERRKLDSSEKAELRKATDEMWASLPESYQWLRDWQYV